MKIYAVNGGPRKGWNTDKLLREFLSGASSVSDAVETEMVYLYDLNYKGCVSCFSCQRDDDKTNGQCQVKDDIYNLLRDIPLSDGVVFGSPIYLHDQTAALRAFLERFVYQFVSFDKDHGSNAPKHLRTAMIYTMNVSRELFEQFHYDTVLGSAERFLQNTFGHKPERLCAFNTYQFDDYSRYRASFWDESQKAAHRRLQFPIDCQSAYELGGKMVNDIISSSRVL